MVIIQIFMYLICYKTDSWLFCIGYIMLYHGINSNLAELTSQNLHFLSQFGAYPLAI